MTAVTLQRIAWSYEDPTPPPTMNKSVKRPVALLVRACVARRTSIGERTNVVAVFQWCETYFFVFLRSRFKVQSVRYTLPSAYSRVTPAKRLNTTRSRMLIAPAVTPSCRALHTQVSSFRCSVYHVVHIVGIVSTGLHSVFGGFWDPG